ncbi:hypothetical protein [Denitromonas iodatirespirans]|uniref:Uncharacterized protein n=1 Tax=Denitromonas iodatirespirans TaxID=2795389 RepID=A0A944DAR1_DENI1|nr:hypothetical protein [Denitromonas iodatirespirans]MBT0961566.1 hypothetical protein [Denitromonas iodatirespirans]
MTNDTAATTPNERRPLDLGWLVFGEPGPEAAEVLRLARQRVLDRLGELFPRFDWQLTVIRRPKAVLHSPCEGSLLLQEGLVEHDERGWDFSFVITSADLQTYYKSYAFAMPSRALSVAVVSLARLLPHDGAAKATDHAAQAERLCHLFLHLLGDLNGIEHRAEATDYMSAPTEAEALDAMDHFDPATVDALGAELDDVADIRLEERPQSSTTGMLGFYLLAIWHLRGDIFSAVIQAEPWQFPIRLNRLTTGAVSTLLILMMTAEAWDLGLGQPLGRMSALSLAILVGTSVFILRRQKLLLRRARGHLSEQIVLTNTAITLVVFLGMASTYLLLLSLSLIAAHLLFSPALVSGWAPSVTGPIGAGHYVALGQLIASFGILIGSLGASFEGHHYFRHIAYVDEEL